MYSLANVIVSGEIGSVSTGGSIDAVQQSRYSARFIKFAAGVAATSNQSPAM
jgi:hypothetical protein